MKPIFIRCLIVAICLLFVVWRIQNGESANSQEGQIEVSGFIDTHMHLDGIYLQKNGRSFPDGDTFGKRHSLMSGRNRRQDGKMVKDYETAADNLVQLMDRYGVAKAIIMPPPQVPNQLHGYTYKDLLGAIRKYPDRLVLAAGGGELNPIIVGTDSSAVTVEIRNDFQKKAEEILRDGAKAFGEMTALHFSFRYGHPFEQVEADHPLFLLLADIAARYDVPIDLHMEAALKDQVLPQKLAQMSSANPSYIKASIPGLERLLDHNKKAKIVWQHVGWDNTGSMTIDLVRKLLDAHPNLFCAFHKGSRVSDENLNIRHGWIQLIRDYPDRFMIGADEFIGTPDKTKRKGPPSFEDTWAIIRQLPSDLQTKVGRENAARVYRLD